MGGNPPSLATLAHKHSAPLAAMCFKMSTGELNLFFVPFQYYFGDHNLPRDKFLKEQIQLDDGWVTLETMLKFNRYKVHNDSKW